MLAISMLLVGAAGASASVSLRTSGGSIILQDPTGSNETVVGYDSGAGEVTIQNTDGSQFGILLYTGEAGGCDFTSDTQINCPDNYSDVKATYAGGNDYFRFFGACFSTATISLGEGTDRYSGESCNSTSTVTVSGGGGQDQLGGSSFNSETIELMDGGGGDDSVIGGGGNDVLHGGDANDDVFGDAGNDQVFGDGGNDDLLGDDGNDVEHGGPGDDRIGFSPQTDDDDQGADDVSGGDGTDKLTLRLHTGGMAISLDDQANDGSGIEGDNIHSDIESIEGTGSNDVFTGSASNNGFTGGSGNDEIHGAGGDDNLSGDGGDDRVYGEAGNDKVEGTNGADIVDGGPGTDQIYGDIASCSVFCNFDPDQLFARDGERDVVDCGGGADSAQVDQLDVVAFCTVVDRATVAVPGGPAVPGGVPDPFGLKVAGSARSKALLKKGLTVRLKCPAACKITAELRYKSKKLGSARKTLKKAGSARLAVKISKKARRTIRRLKKGNLSLRVKVTVAGKTTTLTRTVKFRR